MWQPIMPNNREQKDPKMNDLIAVQEIEGWEKLKALVLDSVSSPITKRVYNMALNEFLAWFQQAPRPGILRLPASQLDSSGRGSFPECRGSRLRPGTVRSSAGWPRTPATRLNGKESSPLSSKLLVVNLNSNGTSAYDLKGAN